jgi:serine/threonine-protein kinase
MSPEQLVAPATVDVRTDIWALGVVLYELITGHRPFRAEPLSLQIIEIVQQPQVPLDRMITGIDPQLVAAVERCLRKQPEERFPDVAAFATALSFSASPTGKAAASKVRSLLATAARPDLASAGAHLFAEHPTDDDREEPTNVVQKGQAEPEASTTRPRPNLYAVQSPSLVEDSATIALASRGPTEQPRPNALRTAAIVGGLLAATALGLGARALLKEAPTHAAVPPGESSARTVAGSASVASATTATTAATATSATSATTATTLAPPTPSNTAATPTKTLPATSAIDTKKKPASREKPSTGTWGGQH